MLYNIKFDENNYVVDLTHMSLTLAGYVAIEVNEIPGDVMCGCYKLENGLFILDEAKKAQYDLDNQPEEIF